MQVKTMVKNIDIDDIEEEPPGKNIERGVPPTDTRGQGRIAHPGLEQWHDWKWQMRHRSHTAKRLQDAFPAFRADEYITRAAAIFPLAITPYYASLIQHWDATDPVFRMAVPDVRELTTHRAWKTIRCMRIMTCRYPVWCTAMKTGRC